MTLTKLHRLLLLALGLMLPLGLAGCPIIDDDDDSAGDDDDSAGDDDDDTADDDDSAADDDDDDDVQPPMTLVDIDIYCEDYARAENSTWDIILNLDGWASALTEPALFMWDGNTFDNHHYIDAWQPLAFFDNTDFGNDPYFDQWQIQFTGWDAIAEADATGETILRCFDSNGVSQVENRNYMVCATDNLDEVTEHCWFCGDDFGAPAGVPSAPLGTVGSFDNGTDMWTATEQNATCVYSTP